MFMLSCLLLLSPNDCIDAPPFFSKPPGKASIYRNLYKFRMFHTAENRPGRGRKRRARSEENVERVLNLISTDMYSSVSYISRLTDISKTRVSRILIDNEMTSYKVGHVQKLMKGDDDDERLKFCRWYLRWSKTRDRVVWWSDDEWSFSIIPQANSQNKRYRSKRNSTTVDELGNSHINVKVWVAISSEGNIFFQVIEHIYHLAACSSVQRSFQ